MNHLYTQHNIDRDNVPGIRLAFRRQCLAEEWRIITDPRDMRDRDMLRAFLWPGEHHPMSPIKSTKSFDMISALMKSPGESPNRRAASAQAAENASERRASLINVAQGDLLTEQYAGNDSFDDESVIGKLHRHTGLAGMAEKSAVVEQLQRSRQEQQKANRDFAGRVFEWILAIVVGVIIAIIFSRSGSSERSRSAFGPEL